MPPAAPPPGGLGAAGAAGAAACPAPAAAPTPAVRCLAWADARAGPEGQSLLARRAFALARGEARRIAAPPRAPAPARAAAARVGRAWRAGARARAQRPPRWARRDSPTCPGTSLWVPPAATVVLALAVLLALRASTGLLDSAAGACSVMLMLAFISQLNYTIVIPDSYPLAQAIGGGAAYSGQMIGIYKPGSCVGSAFTWLILKYRPEIWRTSPRILLTLGLLTSMAGALLYTRLTGLVQSAGDQGQSAHLASFFLLARFLLGVGAGLVMQLTFVSMARLAPAADRPDQMARLQLANTLGIAGGPFMDSVLRLLEFCPEGPLSYRTGGVFQALVLGTGLLATCGCYPCLGEAEDYMRSEPSSPAPSGPPSEPCSPRPAAREGEGEGKGPGEGGGPAAERLRGLGSPRGPGPGGCPGAAAEAADAARRRVIVGSILMATARATSVAGVEAAAVMLLQREYAWEESQVGMSVGLAFLTSIPLKVVHSALREHLSPVNWIRALGVTGLVASCLFLSSGSGVMLIVTTAIVFPTMYLSDALSLGAMQQHCLPDGSLFDANHNMLWFNLAVNGAGHFFGPIVARHCVEVGGQPWFACQQLLLCLAFWATFEAVVRPNYLPPSHAPAKGAPGRPRLGTL